MINLSDYSNYVIIAYILSDLTLASFAFVSLKKYFRLKKITDEK